MVCVQHISKLYRLYRRPSDRILELFPVVRRPLHSDFWALKDVSFGLERGDFLGIVGPNGGGKSTLLQVVSGILQPTSGRVVTRGRIAALLELGAGFNPDFTGRENIFLNGEVLGLSRAEIARSLPSIEAFAEIGDFINRPVKEYSSGMYVRLAFATAIHVDPEILIVDEALAVGDAAFANRCIRKFQELRERRVTVLFVSHDLGLVKQLSKHAILMMNGRIAAEGYPPDVINRYIGLVLDRERKGPCPESIPPSLSPSFRHGDGGNRILHTQIVTEDGRANRSIASGEAITVRVSSVFRRAYASPMVGILIRNRTGIEVYGTNTQIENSDLGNFEPGEELTVEFNFACWLTPGEYTLTVATQNADGSSLDWLDDAIVFQVIGGKRRAGVIDLRAKVEWHKRKVLH
ncbi:MAG: ABC transporter ATP-binding protein [Bryobacterales bacterium]|nr:ABC transporter ATP-binding protein [Bryobacterales bacterium]